MLRNPRRLRASHVTVLALALVSLAAAGAGATPVVLDYDFRGLPDVAPSMAFEATVIHGAIMDPASLPMITATTSVAPYSDWIITEQYVYQGLAGLGVAWLGQNPERRWVWVGPRWYDWERISVLDPVSDLDWNEVDGSGPDETLHLTFSDFGRAHDVGLDLAYVSLIGADDDVSIWLNGAHLGTVNPADGIGPIQIDLRPWGVQLYEEDVLSFTVAQANDDFAVTGIVLSAMTPEPGTIALLGLGLVSLGIGIRRRRS